MIVQYPGPKIVGQARLEPQYLPFFGLELKPGANEVSVAVARQLADAGVVEMPAGAADAAVAEMAAPSSAPATAEPDPKPAKRK
jgi:hypothetical protein